MTTVAEKQGTFASLIDDISTTLLSFGNWSDADNYVTNDGSTDDWFNNGRLLSDSNTGVFLLMFISTDNHHLASSGGDRNDASGVRFVISNDWDGANHHPAGKTNVNNNDPFSGEVGNHRRGSFNNFNIREYYNRDDRRGRHAGVWPFKTHLGGNRSEHRDGSVTYYLSSDGGHLSLGFWNTTDGSNGVSGFLNFEYLDSKFWNDQTDPFVLLSGDRNGIIDIYGFQTWGQDSSGINNHSSGEGPVGDAKWGLINPDSNDDTFFFRRATCYQTNSRKVPISYVYSVIKNDKQEGGAHGDIITYNGTDYRMMQQSGAGDGNTTSVGLKYQ